VRGRVWYSETNFGVALPVNQFNG